MKSPEEVQELRNMVGALLDSEDERIQRAVDPARAMLYTFQNTLCWVLEDGSPHAATVADNIAGLLAWIQDAGVQFLKTHPVKQ